MTSRIMWSIPGFSHSGDYGDSGDNANGVGPDPDMLLSKLFIYFLQVPESR